MTLDEYLKYCLELSKEASPGPWRESDGRVLEFWHESEFTPGETGQTREELNRWIKLFQLIEAPQSHNTKFICESRTAVPLLIKLVEKQRISFEVIHKCIQAHSESNPFDGFLLDAACIEINKALAISLDDLKKELE